MGRMVIDRVGSVVVIPSLGQATSRVPLGDEVEVAVAAA